MRTTTTSALFVICVATNACHPGSLGDPGEDAFEAHGHYHHNASGGSAGTPASVDGAPPSEGSAGSAAAGGAAGANTAAAGTGDSAADGAGATIGSGGGAGSQPSGASTLVQLGGTADFNDTVAYPTSWKLPAPLSIPTGGNVVEVPVGANIATYVEQHPEGNTQFNLAEGTYGGGYDVQPYAGDTFYGVGAGKTILDNVSFSAGADYVEQGHVGIYNLTSRNFAENPYWHAAIDATPTGYPSGTYWDVENVEISDGYLGLSIGPNGTGKNLYIHDITGTGAGQGDNSLLQYIAVINCGHWNGDDPGADGGGVKSSMHHATFRNNYVTLSGEAGVWQDVYSSGNSYLDNVSVNNAGGSGFMLEIDDMPGGNTLTGNLSAHNGADSDTWQGAGFQISNSTHNTLSGNYAWANHTASVALTFQERPPVLEGNNVVTGNFLDTPPDTLWTTAPDITSPNTIGPVSPPRVTAGPQM